MRSFGRRVLLPVRAPFRLDLTSDALRRLASNVVDVVASDGVLYRALRDARGEALVAIRQHDRDSIEVRATGRYAGDLEGVQLWVALPEATRHGAARFEHVAQCPRADVRGGVATVLVGSLLGEASPAAVDSALLGADLELTVPVEVPLDPAFEHVVVALRGALRVGTAAIESGQSAYLAPGAASARCRALRA